MIIAIEYIYLNLDRLYIQSLILKYLGENIKY